MSDEFKDNDQIKAGSKHHDQHAIDHRNLLLGTSTLVAAATLTSPSLPQAQKAAPAAAPAPAAAASGSKPNLDKLAAEGMRFTDYYAEASCTAGRDNFITGQLPLRSGLTTVGQAGADVGMPDQCVTIATVLK